MKIARGLGLSLAIAAPTRFSTSRASTSAIISFAGSGTSSAETCLATDCWNAARARLRSKLTAIWLRYRSEEHTSELQSLMRISYAVFCLKKKKQHNNNKRQTQNTIIQ